MVGSRDETQTVMPIAIHAVRQELVRSMRSAMTGNVIWPTRWPRFAKATALPRIRTNHLGMTTPTTMKKVDAMTARPMICSAEVVP